jgi:peptidyl-prolyl cis-trans isomerase A (cyclophilin A)
MKKQLHYIFIVLVAFGCSEPIKEEQKIVVPKVADKPKPVEKEVAPDLINDENVKEKLLAYGKDNPETVVEIYTTKGKVTVKLFNDTPLHRANFIMMAKKGFYEGSVFTRVVKNFMAQGGGTYNDKQVNIKKQIGAYTIPNEISRKHIHKKGALGCCSWLFK